MHAWARYYLQASSCTHNSHTSVTSPFSTALKSGPSVIAVNGLRADIIEQKCFTRETCRFGNRTSMTLKTSALVSHQKRFAILLTYVHLGNHTRKHRVKQIREKFWIHKSQNKSKIHAAISCLLYTSPSPRDS